MCDCHFLRNRIECAHQTERGESMRQTSDTRYPGKRIRSVRNSSIPFTNSLHDFADDADGVHLPAGKNAGRMFGVEGLQDKGS